MEGFYEGLSGILRKYRRRFICLESVETIHTKSIKSTINNPQRESIILFCEGGKKGLL